METMGKIEFKKWALVKIALRNPVAWILLAGGAILWLVANDSEYFVYSVMLAVVAVNVSRPYAEQNATDETVRRKAHIGENFRYPGKCLAPVIAGFSLLVVFGILAWVISGDSARATDGLCIGIIVGFPLAFWGFELMRRYDYRKYLEFNAD